MPNDSVPSPQVIGLECESLEGASWGTGRIVRNLLASLSTIERIERRYKFICYSNGNLASGIIPDHPAFIARPVGIGWLIPGLRSFSLYYYFLLPLRLWWDWAFGHLAMMYYVNYMLPLIHPPIIPSLVMLTDDIFREVANPDLPFKYRLAYRIFSTGWAKRRATAIHAISRASAQTLKKLGIAPERIRVNELAVTAPRRDVTPVPSTFLFVGQAFERRRLRECLRVFERVAANQPELSFRIIGKDKYRVPTIAALVHAINGRLGRKAITHIEYASDDELAASYAGTSALLYVSDSEAFGLPPLEALAYGAVPIVADTPLTREIYGEHAIMVPSPFGESAIEEAMRRSITDTTLRERIRYAGPDIVSRYTWKRHAEQFLRIAHTLTA